MVCSRAGTSIGGRLTGDLGFLGSTEESVCHRQVLDRGIYGLVKIKDYLATPSSSTH